MSITWHWVGSMDLSMMDCCKDKLGHIWLLLCPRVLMRIFVSEDVVMVAELRPVSTVMTIYCTYSINLNVFTTAAIKQSSKAATTIYVLDKW